MISTLYLVRAQNFIPSILHDGMQLGKN